MPTYNGIEIPCFGLLDEIHAALIKELNWLNEQVSINGWGYTVKEAGFQSNDSGRCIDCTTLALLHPGMAVLYNQIEDPCIFMILTSGKVPHVSKRCALCGCQLNQEEIKHGACIGCHSAKCGH